MAIKLPQASTLAAGATGIAAWGFYLLAQHFNIPITEGQIATAITILLPVIVHITPDGVQKEVQFIDGKLKIVASLIPQTYAEYPQPSPSTTVSNINQ